MGLDVAKRSEPLVEDAPEGPRRILAISTATQVAGSADGMSGWRRDQRLNRRLDGEGKATRKRMAALCAMDDRGKE